MENTERRYKKGYVHIVVKERDPGRFAWLNELKVECEHLIVGIADPYIMACIYGEGTGYGIDAAESFLKEYFPFIDEIAVIGPYDLDYTRLYDRFHFDACFYGSMYGAKWESDREFMKEHNVEFISLIPPNLGETGGTEAMKLCVDNIRSNQKVIPFGTGKYYDIYLEQYGALHEIAYAADNDPAKWDTSKNGVGIYPPDKLKEEVKEDTVVIICAKDYGSVLSNPIFNGFNIRLMLYRNEVALLEEFCQAHLSGKTEEQRSVEEILRKIQEIDYDLLRDFNAICRKYDIDYYLNFGSLLGALRHRGMIPWDNDIDVVMKREDWDKLKEHKDEFPDKYFWLGNDILGKKRYYDCLDRIAYKKAYFRADEDACRFYGNYYNSIHLDIFLIDRTYDDFKGRFQRYELAALYGLMNAYRHQSMFFDYDEKMMRYNRILCFFGRMIPLKLLKWKADKVARRFIRHKDAPYWIISNDVFNKLMMLFPASVFDHSVDVPFRDITAKMAAGADEMCRILFGDYMQLPPEETRVPHCGRVLMTADSFVFEEPERGIKY